MYVITGFIYRNSCKKLYYILSPLQNGNGFSTPNSAKFAEEISNVDIQDDEVMLSFDVVSLFTGYFPSINLISTFCTQFHLFALNFNFLHCLGLIDVLSANELAEIFACVLLRSTIGERNPNLV